jgi:hypothetical protein
MGCGEFAATSPLATVRAGTASRPPGGPGLAKMANPRPTGGASPYRPGEGRMLRLAVPIEPTAEIRTKLRNPPLFAGSRAPAPALTLEVCCVSRSFRLKAPLQRKDERWPIITRCGRTPALPHQEQDRERRARGDRGTDQPAGLIQPSLVCVPGLACVPGWLTFWPCHRDWLAIFEARA